MATLIQYPTGRWGFVGSVPAALAWARKDGEPMTDADWHTVQYCMAPGSFGYKHPSFTTKEDAQRALAQVQS